MAAGFSLSLNESQIEIRDWVHDFAEREIRPVAQEWDEREEYPTPVLEKAAEIGLYGWDFFRNAIADPTGLTVPICLEELGWGCAGIANALGATDLAMHGIIANGTAEQIEYWGPVCYGTAESPNIAALAASEPEAGSDIGAIRTTSKYDASSDEWVLNGQKTWISNGGIADVHVVIASVEPELGIRGQAAFVVGPDDRGLRQGSKFKKHGIRASHTAEVFLDDCRVPGDQLLGGRERLEERLARAREGGATRFQPALATFEAFRPSIGSLAVGISRAATEYATEYAKERRQFGRPIVQNQAIAMTLADMALRTDVARLLVWRACWMAANDMEPTRAEPSQAKLAAGESAVWTTERAIQILGGYGYVRDFPVERWHRDAKIFDIFEGTSEIQRLVIARAVTGVRVD